MVSEPLLPTLGKTRMSDSGSVNWAEVRELVESLSRAFDRRCSEMSAIMKKQLDDVVGRME